MKRKEITDVMKNVTLTFVIMMEVIVDLDSILGSFVMQQLAEEKTVGMFSKIKSAMKRVTQKNVCLMDMIVKQLDFLATNIMMLIVVIIMAMGNVMKAATMLHVAGMDLTVNHQLKNTRLFQAAFTLFWLSQKNNLMRKNKNILFATSPSQ